MDKSLVKSLVDEDNNIIVLYSIIYNSVSLLKETLVITFIFINFSRVFHLLVLLYRYMIIYCINFLVLRLFLSLLFLFLLL